MDVSNAPYRVLGDDLTLLYKTVAEFYLRFIHAFGMEYSVDKTYIQPGSAEFAKSLYRGAEELTPFPASLLVFDYSTVVSSSLSIIDLCGRRKIPITSAVLLGFYPRKWRKHVLLGALSPSVNKAVLDLRPRANFDLFLAYYDAKRINYFTEFNTLRSSTSSFVLHDPA